MSSVLALFGKVVRRLRTEAGFSQESFADAIGVHRNYVGTVERGETNITLENIHRIAAGLKRPMWLIFSEMETESSAAPTHGTRSAPKSQRQPIAQRELGRVAERRVEVREQLQGLVQELKALDELAKESEKGGSAGKKRGR